MAAEELIERILDVTDRSSGSAVDALHALLDDSMIEERGAPRGIADVAEILALSPHTLRYYEQEGLVLPARNASGYREYSAHDMRRLVFLARMRLSGMTMRELKRYIALVEHGDATIAERRRIMLEQRERIKRKLRELTFALEATEYKIRSYGGAPTG